MGIKIDYLDKNILLGLALLIIIDLIIFNSSFLAKYSIFERLLVPLLLFLIAGLLLKRTNNFISGFAGEKDIDAELKSLGADFICIKSGLDTGKGNIDKIVLGPTGVWSLEVKSHIGNISFEGDTLLNRGKPFEKDFLGQAYAEAKTLEDLIRSKLNIEIKVQPVVVFSNKYANVRLGLRNYRGVYVIQKGWLKKLLTENHIQSLDKETALTIKNIIEG